MCTPYYKEKLSYLCGVKTKRSNMNTEKTEKRPVGRPRLGDKKMKSYHYKAAPELVPILDSQSNRNAFINEAIREKAERDNLL